MLALAYREGQVAAALIAALGDAARDSRAERVSLAPLSPSDAARPAGVSQAFRQAVTAKPLPLTTRAFVGLFLHALR